jgi:hypothetical protein
MTAYAVRNTVVGTLIGACLSTPAVAGGFSFSFGYDRGYYGCAPVYAAPVYYAAPVVVDRCYPEPRAYYYRDYRPYRYVRGYAHDGRYYGRGYAYYRGGRCR